MSPYQNIICEYICSTTMVTCIFNLVVHVHSVLGNKSRRESTNHGHIDPSRRLSCDHRIVHRLVQVSVFFSISLVKCDVLSQVGPSSTMTSSLLPAADAVVFQAITFICGSVRLSGAVYIYNARAPKFQDLIPSTCTLESAHT